MQSDSWLPFAIALILPYTVATIESINQKADIQGWFSKLKKAPWNPPNWVFGPVWSVIYGLMGYASYLVWYQGQITTVPEVKQQVEMALIAYGVQLVLNWAWSPLFFKLHLLGVSLIEFAVLWIAVVITIYDFYPVSHLAAYLLIPYILWGSYAITLNFYIWLYNDSSAVQKQK